MKILVITDYYREHPENGSEVFCCELVRALRQWHEIDVCSRQTNKPNFSTDGTHWLILDSIANDRDMFTDYLINRIPIGKYDIVYNLGALLFGCRAIQILRSIYPKLPVVNHFQALLGPYAQAEGRCKSDIESHEAGQLLAATNARHNIFISTSEYGDALRSGMELTPPKVSIIPNGLQFPDSVVQDRSFLPIRHHNSVVVTTAGRFSDYVKGADLIYRAYAELAEQNSTIYLLSIGDSDRFASLLAPAPKDQWQILKWLPRQRFHSVLAGSDIVVLPSRHEPFGLIAIEALALGVPVVANAVGGLSEIIHHRRFGLLNPDPKDYHGLRAAVEELVSDCKLRRTMGTAGSDFVRREYSIARISALTEAALQKAAIV